LFLSEKTVELMRRVNPVSQNQPVAT
jgi:hypothetical protein